MKIYVLLKEGHDSNVVCVSEDITKIRKSICKDFTALDDYDYPKLEIWEDGEKIYQIVGNDVLYKIAEELRD